MKSKSVSSIAISIIMIGSYILSFSKESLLATLFGITQEMDAYTIAIQIPITLFALVAVSIRSFVIPIYSNCLYNEGNHSANRFISNLCGILFIIIFVFILLGEIFADYIIHCFAPGFSAETHKITVDLFRITLPSIIFIALNDVFSAVLNVNKKYVFTSLAIYILNICIIICIVVLHSKFGILSAVIGQIFGSFIQLMYMLFLSKNIFSYIPVLQFKDPKIKESAKMSIPLIWSISVAEVNTIVNKIVASSLFVGSISVLNYSSKLNSIFIALMTNIVSVILYPHYAELAAKKDFKRLNEVCNFSFGSFSMMVLPLIVLLLIYKQEIVEIAFARGKFDASAVALTQDSFMYYTLGLLFIAFRGPITQIFFALKDTKTPAKNATIGVILNIILNVTLPFFMGVNGLALATSISGAFIVVNLFIKLLKKREDFKMDYFYTSLKKVLITTVVMMMVILLFEKQVYISNIYIKPIIGFCIGSIIYISALWILRVPVFFKLMANFRLSKNKE